jgi:hypothetical protein
MSSENGGDSQVLCARWELMGNEVLMDHMWARVTSQLIARVTGPMKFRLVLQPAMASFLAIRAGLADARAGKPPYFWGVVWNRGHRAAMIKDGWKSIGKVFILAVLLDVVYQIIVLRFVYVGETVIVAFLLAIVPYLLIRGPVTRLARKKKTPAPTRSITPPNQGNAA